VRFLLQEVSAVGSGNRQGGPIQDNVAAYGGGHIPFFREQDEVIRVLGFTDELGLGQANGQRSNGAPPDRPVVLGLSAA
jgi:hypothetical protein